MTPGEYLERTKKLLRLRNYSPRTQKIYLSCLRKYFEAGGLDHLGDESFIESYLLAQRERGLASQSVNLFLNAIKFFYHKVLANGTRIQIRFAKRSRRLPVVLSRMEIERLLMTVRNHKHRTMIALSYASGLRISELVNLRVGDVDLQQKFLMIRHAKGDKDRISLLAEGLFEDLQRYLIGRGATQFLFESEWGGALSSRSLQKVFARALLSAGILKPATFHSLRHSFATHLIEKGVNLRYVQQLLGHASIRTTEIYTHVSTQALQQIESPY